ncbi:uncharacterized protein BXZ73DRAFT_80122 [Epithele typhae]|uniref:uncharacterized protein n=1 Tax=Epithele typhae TaxID=378194 RepID=UPI002008BE62|nr:uncharacterized protein BXZ73DRAFT_80122 [Epithele typhae]KAH9920550.1 hypothetical protein BXZ73DRAFT_80122 [Epithele typhae]
MALQLFVRDCLHLLRAYTCCSGYEGWDSTEAVTTRDEAAYRNSCKEVSSREQRTAGHHEIARRTPYDLSLRSLSYRTPSNTFRSSMATSGHPHSNAFPNLEALAMVGHWSCTFPENGFPRLTHLFLDCATAKDVFDLDALFALLARTSVLQSLHLCHRIAQKAPTSEQPPIPLLHLTSLALAQWDVFGVCTFLGHLLPEAPFHTFVQANMSTNSYDQYYVHPMLHLLHPFLPALSVFGHACIIIQDTGKDAGFLLESHGQEQGPTILLDMFDGEVPRRHHALLHIPRRRGPVPLPRLEVLAICANCCTLEATSLLATSLKDALVARRAALKHLIVRPLLNASPRADGEFTSRPPRTVPFRTQLPVFFDAGLDAHATEFHVLPPMGRDEPCDEFGLLSLRNAEKSDEHEVLLEVLDGNESLPESEGSEGRIVPTRWEAATARGKDVRERYWRFLPEDALQCDCDCDRVSASSDSEGFD